MKHELYTSAIALTSLVTILLISAALALHYRARAKARIRMYIHAKEIIAAIKAVSKSRGVYDAYAKTIRSDIYEFYKAHKGKVDQEILEFHYQSLCALLNQADKLTGMYA